MGNIVYPVGPLTNEQIIDSLIGVWTDSGSPQPSEIRINCGDYPVNCATADALANAQIQRFRQSDKLFIKHAQLNLHGPAKMTMSWTASEPGRPDTINITFESNSPVVFDAVEVAVARLPRLQTPFLPEGAGVWDKLSEFYKYREAALVRLEQAHEKSILIDAETRARLVREADEAKAALEQKYLQRQVELELRYQEKCEEIAKREAELDASDAKNARRKHMAKIQDMLKDRGKSFGLTKETEHKRTPVVLACMISAGISLAAFGWFMWHSELGIRADISRMLSALAFGGIIWFYIRWNNSWFQQHATEEFRLKRLDLDMVRASWLVELALEWGEQGKGELPPDLLEHLAVNLFREAEPEKPAAHPAEEALGALLGASAGVKVKTAAGELEFDRKSMRQLQKDSGS